MPQLNKLLPRQVTAMIRNGVDGKDKIVSDGGGLFLRLRKGGGANWLFVSTAGGVRREAGLGPATTLHIEDAREKAAEMRRALAQGRDPFEERAVAKREKRDAAKATTFGAFANEYIASIEGGWKNEKHRLQWKSSLEQHAQALWKKRLDQIDTDDVLAVLNPIWRVKPETARRVRGRIERILDAAKARGLRPRDSINPAAYRGHLQTLLSLQDRKPKHHKALPVEEAPAFMAKLRTRPALAARALEFTVLTAARTSEAIGATWGEINLGAALWVVPATRMKAGQEHRVPLSSAAVAILKALRPAEAADDVLVFGVGGKPLSNMAMTMVLRRMGRDDITVHGMRSTFRDWAGDVAGLPRELAEQALAHTIQNKAERAYRRGTAVERRRELMESWAKFLARKPAAQPAPPPVASEAAGDLQTKLGLFDPA